MTTVTSKNALLHTLHTTKVESTLVCCYAANGKTFAISWKQLWFYLYILTFSTAEKFCNGVPQGMIYQTKFPFSSHAVSLARSSHIYMTVWRLPVYPSRSWDHWNMVSSQCRVICSHVHCNNIFAYCSTTIC